MMRNTRKITKTIADNNRDLVAGLAPVSAHQHHEWCADSEPLQLCLHPDRQHKIIHNNIWHQTAVRRPVSNTQSSPVATFTINHFTISCLSRTCQWLEHYILTACDTLKCWFWHESRVCLLCFWHLRSYNLPNMFTSITALSICQSINQLISYAKWVTFRVTDYWRTQNWWHALHNISANFLCLLSVPFAHSIQH